MNYSVISFARAVAEKIGKRWKVVTETVSANLYHQQPGHLPLTNL